MSVIFLMVFCAFLITAGSGYYWCKERRDKESAQIYRSFFWGFLLMAVGGTAVLLPEHIMERYGHWLYLILGLFTIEEIVSLILEYRQVREPKKYISGIVIMILILMYCIYCFLSANNA